MKKSIALCIALSVVLLLAFGCSGSNNSPMAPDSNLTPSPEINSAAGLVQPMLVGYYDVYIDPEAETIEAVPNRNAEFLVNIVKFLNNNPFGVGLGNFYFENQGDNFYVELDWSILHPVPVSPDIDVYDMRAAIILDGSGTLAYNPDLTYGVPGTDQIMVNADGYTRWFNKTEFITTTFQGYNHGNLAADTMNCDATLNPYIYYCDSLGTSDNLYDWLTGNPASVGKFTAGANLARRMILNFPLPTPGIHFGYSIFCAWEDVAVQTNVPEAIACDADVTQSLYYTGTEGGGNLIADFSLFGWGDLPSQLYIESTVLALHYVLDAGEMIPVDSGTNWATWHVDIPGDSVTSTEGQEFWVIAEYDGHDYVSPFSIPNDADTDILASCFRFPLVISPTSNFPPVVESGVDGPVQFNPTDISEFTVTATDPEMDPLDYTWIVLNNDTSLEVYTQSGSDDTLSIDWPTVPAVIGETYTISCTVTDLDNPPVWADPLVTECVENPNHPPVIDSGVDGDNWALSTTVDPRDYTVDASDPDLDPLTYSWRLIDLSDSSVVLSGPGDSAGMFTVSWGLDVVVSDGELFSVECDVSDPVNPTVYAAPLEVHIGNLPPIVIDPVSGNDAPEPTNVETYSTIIVDSELDLVIFEWTVIDTSDSSTLTSGPGDGDGNFVIDWGSFAVADGEEYEVNCMVNDPYNPPVDCGTLVVTITSSGIITLWLYDGMIDDGNIVDGTWGMGYDNWDYCGSENAWQNYNCINYPDAVFDLCRSPYFDIPATGTVHVELWHWGEMPTDGYTYGDLGTAWDNGGLDYQDANWVNEFMVYEDGMDFNDTTGYEDFIGTYGSESTPEWSHFILNAYAGEERAICFAVEEWGGTSGGAYSGWHVRKCHVWVEP